MTTPQWISIIVTLVGAAAVWGSLRNQVGNLETRVAELRAMLDKQVERLDREQHESAKDQGIRLQKLETAAAVRRATHPRGVSIATPASAKGDTHE